MSRSFPIERDEFIQTSESFLEMLLYYLLPFAYFFTPNATLIINPSYQLPMLSEPETVKLMFRRLVEI
jgi:hypothetical protein